MSLEIEWRDMEQAMGRTFARGIYVGYLSGLAVGLWIGVLVCL